MRKKVSKRVIGAITYVVGISMAIATGFNVYDVDAVIILTILGNGTALLGIDAWRSAKKKR